MDSINTMLPIGAQPSLFTNGHYLTKECPWAEVQSLIVNDDSLLRRKQQAMQCLSAGDSAGYSKAKSGPFITPAVACNGGHAWTNATAFTSVVGVEFDHIDPELIPLARQIADECPHTLISWVTTSNVGLFVGVLTDFGKEQLSRADYTEAWKQVDLYYERLVGLPTDKAVKDPTRCRFLTHDPLCHLNPSAVPFAIKWHQTSPPIRAAPRALVRPVTDDPMNRARSIADTRGSYIMGNRHNYAYHVICLLNELGVCQSETKNLCLDTFADLERDDHNLSQMVDSIYRSKSYNYGKLSN